MATGGIAQPFEYPEGASDRKKETIRDETLRGNTDTLFYDTNAEGERCSLMMRSTRVREWLNVMNQNYPELEEAQQDDIINLKCEEGTVTVVVRGQLMERFERDFLEIKQMAKLNIRRFKYPKGASGDEKEKIREKKLRGNTDTLFEDTNAEDERCSLMFYSTLVREWLNAMKQKYPELEESQQDGNVKLECEEGTVRLDPSVKVLVRGQKLMKRFESDFPEMRRMARPLWAEMAELNIHHTGARPFKYPEGASDGKKENIRDETLRGNKDTLFYNTTTKDDRCSLMFYSAHVREWLDVMKQKYPELEESQQDNIIQLKLSVKSSSGTITLYHSVTVVVRGQLMERFEKDFLQMKQKAQSREAGRQDEPEDEGPSSATPN